MKAVVYTRYGSPDVLELREVARPAPKADQVLVRVHAASANALDYRRFQRRSVFGRLREEVSFRTTSKVLGADISTAAKRLILAGNVQRILQPILRQKGIHL